MKMISLLLAGLPFASGASYYSSLSVDKSGYRLWNKLFYAPTPIGSSPPSRGGRGKDGRRREGAFCSTPSTSLPPLADLRDDDHPVAAALSPQSPPARVAAVPRIFPARMPLPSFLPDDDDDDDDNDDDDDDGIRRRPSFSILSWNILLPNSRDNWWCHKQYASNVDMSKRTWPHRRGLIRERIAAAEADVVCIQEADGETFDDDFDFMVDMGYDHVLHKKFRFRCATFYRREKFELDREAHKDRSLVTSLLRRGGRRRRRGGGDGGGGTGGTADDDVLHIVNCHLSGGAAPERRLRQVSDGLEQIRKWTNALERDLAQRSGGRKKRDADGAVVAVAGDEGAERTLSGYRNAGIVVCGDFNSDGNTAVRRLLVDGRVDPDWREPQYPGLPLSSRAIEQTFGPFADAAELAYGGNVCDGDYPESRPLAGGTWRA